MQLYLQFGWGMQDHCKALLRDWGGGTVILSPRDIEPDRLPSLSKELTSLRGRLLLDPQFYLPNSDHWRLRTHKYWPEQYQSGAFWAGAQLQTLLDKLRELNEQIVSHELILPGLYAERVDDDWLARQNATMEMASKMDLGRPALATVALSAEALLDRDQMVELRESVADWFVEGVYLVCEHPNGAYLVEHPIWLSNLLDLVASMRQKCKRVTIGYCTHQMLLTACASAYAVAAGTWMKTRTFDSGNFTTPEDEEQKQQATWYYCPQALSEFKTPFLLVAQRQGVLEKMLPPASCRTIYSSGLTPEGAANAAPVLTQPSAFRHYLHCLRAQVEAARRPTFDETVACHRQALDEAEGLLTELHAAGIFGQHRDFSELVDINRAALQVLMDSRGPMLKRDWPRLT